MKKTLVIGVILLFLGVGFQPALAKDVSIGSSRVISNLIMENHPPNPPEIDGPVCVKPGLTFEYTFNAVDPDGDNVSYFVEWGDGTSDGWAYYFPSGIDATFAHTWGKRTKNYIRAKAKDYPYEAESDWSYFVFRDKSSNLELNNNEDCFECQPVNRVTLLKVRLLLIKLRTITNIIKSRFGHIPEIQEKCEEVFVNVASLRERINDLKPDLPWEDNPIICSILLLMLTPLFLVGSFFMYLYYTGGNTSFHGRGFPYKSLEGDNSEKPHFFS